MKREYHIIIFILMHSGAMPQHIYIGVGGWLILANRRTNSLPSSQNNRYIRFAVTHIDIGISYIDGECFIGHDIASSYILKNRGCPAIPNKKSMMINSAIITNTTRSTIGIGSGSGSV